MYKIHILTTCPCCQGATYFPVTQDSERHLPCPICHGNGEQPQWVEISELRAMPHEHTSLQGRMHFSQGDVWDDIHETCYDRGANLES